MKKYILVMSLGLVVAATSALAQRNAPEGGTEAVVRGILDAIMLPEATEDAREAGVPEEDIGAAIDLARERSLPPGETRTIIEETTTSVREHGPIDNFGAFVQARLEEGLRGRDLAAAIRAEHQARGRGKGATKGQRGKGKDKGRDHGDGPDEDEDDNDNDNEDAGEEKKEKGNSGQNDKNKKGKGGGR